MTSMLLTRAACGAVLALIRWSRRACLSSPSQQSRGVIFFSFAYFGRAVFDHRLTSLLVRLDPVGDEVPLLAVPLLDARPAEPSWSAQDTLIGAHQAVEAELLEPLVVEVQVLEAPAHLLAGHRLVAELALRGADRLDDDPH